MWYAVAAPRSELLGPVFSGGRPEIPAIALTFDDGPGAETASILNLLHEANARATFFLCGSHVEQHPSLARRIAEDGHEIGNHTYSHPRLLGRTPGKIFWEIERTQKVIEHHAGRRPQLFRPPYGLRWFGLSGILQQQRMTTVMWSVNGRDWKTSAEQITEQILRQAHPGAIILLHDAPPPGASGDRKATVAALPALLQILGRRYRFVTVSEMQSQMGS